jgi:hypothetical protein
LAGLSHYVIASLYYTLKWYYDNKEAPISPRVLSLFRLWRSLHASFVNISEEGWRAIRELAEGLKISISTGTKSRKDDEWLFLYALESYLNIVMRAIALSKLGGAAADAKAFVEGVKERRNIFEHNVFEWFFDALEDQCLQGDLRNKLENSINLLLEIIYHLDLLYVSTDIFREVYQNILPSEVRKSLGEFYTSDNIVRRVLDAAGLDDNAVRELYDRWKRGEEDVIILDPACGSGSFLVDVVGRIFSSFKDKIPEDIVKFVEGNLVGIDINPFAVEMARLNMVIAISTEMAKRGGAYVPTRLRVYWADSLARPENEQGLHNYTVAKIRIPVLRRVVGEDSINIPFHLGADPLKILDDAVERASTDSGVAEFMERVARRFFKAVPRDVIAPTLKSLYNTLKAIYSSGNSRIINMVRNVVAVQALIGKCGYVIGNPPWVRIQNLDKSVVEYLKENYEWIKEGTAYDPKFKKTKIPFKEQPDYSVAFVERGLKFLKDGGILSYVITSKVIRATYSGKMREDLVEKYTVLELIDYSLYPVPLFKDVVNYPLVISVKKAPPPSEHEVKVTTYNTGGEGRSFCVRQGSLPLFSPGTNRPNNRSPWVLAPPEIIVALKRVISANPRLGDLYKVMRGVMTSLNEGYMGSLVGFSLSQGLVKLRLEGGKEVEVEEFLVHPLVRGEDIDPYTFSWGEYLIFPHDPSTFKPLWNSKQREILELLGLLSSKESKVSASGGTLKYELEYKTGASNVEDALKVCADKVASSIKAIEGRGFKANRRQPCEVTECLDIVDRDGSSILKVGISTRSDKDKCLISYSVAGLEIPKAPEATRHFTQLFERLVKRDDYRVNLPPWVIFRVSKDKFKEYRIAWQEIAKYVEAVHLPVFVDTNICGAKKRKLLVPIQKVYFIVEEGLLKALKLLIYMNTDFARSLIKLWAWSARGGYYEHTSYGMGLLPIPKALVDDVLWEFLEDRLKGHQGLSDLNAVAKGITKEFAGRLEEELVHVLGVSKEEYEKLVEYGRWLNELKALPLTGAEEKGESLEE